MFNKIDDYRWKIPKTYKLGMRVSGVIYSQEKMLFQIKQDKVVAIDLAKGGVISPRRGWL